MQLFNRVQRNYSVNSPGNCYQFKYYFIEFAIFQRAGNIIMYGKGSK